MKKNIIILLFLCFYGCQERKYEPMVKSDNKPGVVSEVNVENLPGSAKISYVLPDDNDLLYILAVFNSPEGVERSVKSSVYTNFVVLDGFADMEERAVKLYAVNRSENRSEPVDVIIKPMKAHLHTVFESLNVQETFGGVNATFANAGEEEYVFHTLYKGDDGKWVPYDRLYSKAKERDYAVRGLPAEPLDFAFYFADKWKNHSDTLLINLTPLFEEKLDKNLWKHKALPTDTYTPEYDSWGIENLWDNDIDKIFFVKAGLPGLVLPNWFTIDLGVKSKLSRVRVNQLSYHPAWIFADGAPKEFEVYGSNDPNSDGSWGSWTLISKFTSVKPSGKPLGELTDEDIRVAKAGEDFTFPLSAPAFRYIRFKTYKTWAGSTNTMMGELTFWGQAM